MREYRTMPRPYELMALISPEVADEALTEEVDRISQYVADNGGQVTYIKRDTPWGRRRLIYPIQRFRDATYVLYHLSTPPTSIIEIERELKLDERVIRYLLVRREEPRAEEPAEEAPEAAAEPAEQDGAEVEAEPAGTAEAVEHDEPMG